MERHLITTADERSWKFDRPVLFLGEWCRRYERRNIWGGMDGVVAEPLIFPPDRKAQARELISVLYHDLLAEISDALNYYHKTNHGVRYWNILLGYWLQRYVTLIYNRYTTIAEVFNSYEIAGTTLFDCEAYSLATQNSSNFLWAADNDLWNHCLYSKILRFFGKANGRIDTVSIDPVIGFDHLEATGITAHAAGRIDRMKTWVRRAAQSFAQSDDAFIVSSYLPPWQEVALQIHLGQFPQRWTKPTLGNFRVNLAVRRELQVKPRSVSFDQFARSLMWEALPVCYLEGYPALIRQLEELPWPKNPKFIFTSNSFDTDEITKAWIGGKVESGVPYFVGQHGNNYGTHVESGQWPEQITCDKFFTWGWSNDSVKDVPTFVFTLAGSRKTCNPNGGLLLVETCQYHRFDMEDNVSLFCQYLEQQFRFVKALPFNIRENLTVRLNSAYRHFSWREDDRWNEFDPLVAVEKGVIPIDKLLAKNRLVVHSYDSTGILETLASNIPTMCFWQGGLDHLLPSAKQYYERLRRVGILADSPEQAARNVTECWDDVQAWWLSAEVQSARNCFCAQYARTSEDPVRDLKRILMSQVDQ